MMHDPTNTSPAAEARGHAGLPGVPAGAGDGPARFDLDPLRKPERVFGPLISFAVHALFLLIAAWLVVNPPLKPGDPGVEIDFASLALEELVEIADDPFRAVDPPADPALFAPSDSPIPFEAEAGSVTIDPLDLASTDLLGGAGESADPGEVLGGGGGGGTSFFGIAARGSRFVFIVDISGSMNFRDRIGRLRDELTQAIDALPDNAMYHLIAYNHTIIPMGGAHRWTRADGAGRLTGRTWIRNLGADGGTEPTPAFEPAFNLRPRPDVIYFMTDGHNIVGLPAHVAALNNRGRRVRVHCIVFGDPEGEEMMKRIAAESGGTYRFVPDGGGP